MKIVSFLIFFTGLIFSVSAQVKSTTSNGNWFDPNIWSPVGVPLMEDTVIINHDVTVSGNYVDFGANWLIVQPSASIVGDTIFSLHGNLKMHGLMDMQIIAVGDGDSTQVYGTIQGRKYIPGNTYNYNNGTILSDSLILGSHFENYSNIMVMELVIGGPVNINHSGAYISASGSTIFGGPVSNESNGIMELNSLLTSENFINNGIVNCYDWTHAQGNVDGITGKFCVENCFMNVSNIGGTVDICDNSPGGFCDVNMGTIAATVTFCTSGPCSAADLLEHENSKLTVFPSPAKSVINVTTSNRGQIILCNSIGQECGRYETNGFCFITLNEMKNGIYYVKFEGEIRKFMILN